MNLTPRPRDLTALLNSDRTEPADTGRLKLKSPTKITASWVITPATMAMDQE